MNMDSIVSKKPFMKLSNESIFKLFILLIYGIIFFYQHYPLGYVGDDLIMGPGVWSYSLKENFDWHWVSNGRIITDVFANIWYRIPMMYWKVFDTGIYILVALLLSRIFSPNRWYHLLATCGLVLLFPFKYMESAGYIATSANYLYPVFGVLIIVLMIKRIMEDKKISILLYVAVALSIVYITNHDQTAVALLFGMLCFMVYCNITKASPRLTKHAIAIFVISTVMYISFFLIVPGHSARMQSTVEMDTWFPEYANWTFLDKVFHGYTSTVANLFYNDVRLFTLFTIILLVASLRKREPFKIIVGCIPFLGVALSHFMGAGKFIYYFDRSIGMPELIPLYILKFPFILSVIMLGCIFLTIWLNIDKLENKLLLTLLLILAAGTREMMGFTATIYASSYRTFTFFLYALIACILIILKEIEEDEKNSYLWYMGFGAIIALLTI